MEIRMSRASLSLAVLIVIVCSVDAMNYLAFPRMGRSVRNSSKTDGRKVVLPRFFISPRKRSFFRENKYEVEGRSGLPSNFIVPRKKALPGGFILPRKRGYLAFPRMGRSQSKSGADCCGIGLKSEFLIGQDGKEEMRSVCTAGTDCCDGLREMVDLKPDGVYYAMCVPDLPQNSVSR